MIDAIVMTDGAALSAAGRAALAALVVGTAIVLSARVLLRGSTDLGEARTRSLATNAGLVAVNFVAASYLHLSAGWVAQAIAPFGGPLIAAAHWDGVPWILTVLAALLGFDLCDYWNHRLMHARALWGVHAVHHSDASMNWTTTFRVHPLEPIIMAVSYILLLSWLQFPPWALAASGLLKAWHNKYVHCDLAWSHGRLSWLLASPNWHRWHHARVPDAYGKNLANVFPFWDVLFGTHYEPGVCYAPTGLEPEDGVSDTVVGSALHPFRYWARMIRDDTRARRAGAA